MKITKLAPIAVALMMLTVSAGSAFADPHHGWGNDHRGNGHWGQRDNRIHQGIRNGSLTRPEARRLMVGERRLDRAHRVAMRDGDINRREAYRLRELRQQQNRNIHREMRDRQNRW
jgi:hypothetical protein